MDERIVKEKAVKIPGATFPQEIVFLYKISSIAPKKSIFVELGVYQGRTLVPIIFSALEKNNRVVSIDNYGYSEPKAIPSSIEIVKNNLVNQNVLTSETDVCFIDSDSRKVPDFINKNIGFLFVDTTHTKKHFDQEMEVWLPHIIKNGIIACHDYNSPRWVEMSEAIDSWFRTKDYKFLGLERRTIGFQKII